MNTFSSSDDLNLARKSRFDFGPSKQDIRKIQMEVDSFLNYSLRSIMDFSDSQNKLYFSNSNSTKFSQITTRRINTFLNSSFKEVENHKKYHSYPIAIN